METTGILRPLVAKFKGRCRDIPPLEVPRRVRLIAFIVYGIKVKGDNHGTTRRSNSQNRS